MASFPRDVATTVNKEVSDTIRRSVEKPIRLAFQRIKSDMIKEFLNHPVTQEIMNGPAAENSSGTLNGYGNLFSYIGFYDGDDPIKPVLEEFEKSDIIFSRLVDGGAIWNIYIPDKEDIWAASPMPWASGRSWAKGIETSISGIGYYLYSERKNLENSRSSTAVQVQTKIGRPRFRNVKYISDILAKYQKKISALDETSIST
jgi:hypothetical protein